jgi:hypothetical protein
LRGTHRSAADATVRFVKRKISKKERREMKSGRLTACAVALALVQAIGIASPSAYAGISSTTGTAQIVSPPHSVVRGAWESNTRTRVFTERLNVTLEGNLATDISAIGRCDSPEGCSPLTIEGGTMINSYFVHQDAIGHRGNIFLQSSITFDEEILGVIVSNENLSASDFLGAHATLYPSGSDGLRTLDYPAALDAVSISEDRHTLSLELQTQVAMDHIRIITLASPVPAPGSLALLGLAGLTAIGGRRSRHA